MVSCALGFNNQKILHNQNLNQTQDTKRPRTLLHVQYLNN